MIKFVVLLSFSAAALAAGRYWYVFGKQSGETIFQDNIREDAEMGQYPVYRQTFVMHQWPGAEHLFLSGINLYEYIPADGNIRMYTAYPYKTKEDHIVTSVGAGKSGVFVYAAEKLNTFWFVVDGELRTCLLNACPSTTRTIASVGSDVTALQLMNYSSDVIVVRGNADVRAWNLAGVEVDVRESEKVTWQEWFSTKSSHCTGRVLFMMGNRYCIGQRNTVFKNGAKLWDIGDRTLNWIAESMYDEFTIGYSSDKLMECTSGNKPISGGHTIDGWFLDGMSSDARYDGKPSATCGDSICDSTTETHESCNYDCCPAGVAAYSGMAKALCNVTCGAGHYVPAGSKGDCAAFVCPAGYIDHDQDPATPCVLAA